MIISDGKIDLFECKLPSGYKTQAHMELVSFPRNQKITVEAKAVKGNCVFCYRSGDLYLYEKRKIQNPFGFSQQPSQGQNDLGAWYAAPQSLSDDIDAVASSLLNKKLKAKEYLDLSDKLSKRLEEEYRQLINEFISNAQFGLSMAAVPMGICVRKYLLDGAIGIYEEKDRICAVFLSRRGFEYDTVNMNGIFENISSMPFGQAELDMNTPISTCDWEIPYICYMISDKKEDLKDFLVFVESLEITKQFKKYCSDIKDQVTAFQKQQAQMENMQNQAMWANAFAQQQASWAASDRLRDSLSRDLDSWRSNLNQTMAQNDMRFTAGSSNGESSDDYIQRLRHESIMGVETYERNDGSTVEYSNYADRVFENNLDSTQHFGTHHYFDDYVPEGWHEMKKK